MPQPTEQPRRALPDGRTMNSRQVNLLLEVLLIVVVATGIVSWGVGTGWARWWTAIHAVAGLGLVVLAPAKIRGSARTGFRRRRRTRWLSSLFGMLVVAAVLSGAIHASGLWYGVGYWTPLWTHFLLAFAAMPLFLWHLWSRPSRPKEADLDRRFLLRSASVVGVSAAVVGSAEVVVRAAGLAGGDRRFTGSHEIASLSPPDMPVVSWINDATPRFTAIGDGFADWSLSVEGRQVKLEELVAATRPLEAALDCTGGWWSLQCWDVVPLSEVLTKREGRSIVVRSHTGYARAFPMDNAENVYLAVGYDGQPLSAGHGAPVRLVVPGRRGPWWVKWVTSVETSDRPWWLQLPFPAT